MNFIFTPKDPAVRPRKYLPLSYQFLLIHLSSKLCFYNLCDTMFKCLNSPVDCVWCNLTTWNSSGCKIESFLGGLEMDGGRRWMHSDMKEVNSEYEFIRNATEGENQKQ